MRAAFACCDWDDTEEVTTLFYMTKDLVQGRRAADELMLDWDDVQWVEATAETSGGAVRGARAMAVARAWRCGPHVVVCVAGGAILVDQEQPRAAR